MANNVNFGSPVNFNSNQALGFVPEILGSDPSSPANGRVWINSSGGAANWALKWNDNGTIKVIPSILQVLALRLDQFAAPTVDLSMNSHKVTNVLDPTNAQDAATMAWVQNLFNGKDWKDSVRIATTANITLSGLQTIDGITTVANDRVLVKDQTTGTQNGFYLASSGAWTRTTDADTSAKLTPNTAVFVEEGTVNADKQFQLTTNAPITLGTTSLTFTVTGTSTTYTQGTGISISGSTISIDTTVVVRKISIDFGDGTASSFNLTHSFNTLNPQVTFREKATGDIWFFDNKPTSGTNPNQITVTSGFIPTASQFTATIQG